MIPASDQNGFYYDSESVTVDNVDPTRLVSYW
jgi:hypothetical protein